MGNLLVGIAPSQIFPVEHYLADQTNLRFDVGLGSTRFFKVARARSLEGLIVVKVFVIHDPTLPLSAHKEKLEDIRSKLSSAVNCLPFQRMILSEKTGLIMREYIHLSLHTRSCTRPFLSSIEKKWITFQVLYALHQAHKFGVCHGDIKLQNIMITSWNWVLLTDFASFKPTYLPEDNPADFSYFFDTSGQRTCYIAPERFVKTFTSEPNSSLIFPEHELKNGDLHPAMDIFSAGCSLLELYNEGLSPFDFSQLLAYRSGEYSVEKHLDKIKDVGIRELLASMIEKNPSKRKSAELYLSLARGKVFPEYFYNFLQPYMQIFSVAPILSPDEKINRLNNDIANITNMFKKNKLLCSEKTNLNLKTEINFIKHDFKVAKEQTLLENNEVSDEDIVKKSQKLSYLNSSSNDNSNDKHSINFMDLKVPCELEEGIIIIIQLVTSCIRGLHHSQSKLQSLEIMLTLAKNISDEIILDRILPYIFYLVYDAAPRVRVSAIHTLTKTLSLVKKVPSSDINIFPEYILPGLSQLTSDEAVIVRSAYAENIAQLSNIALRYLESAHSLTTEVKDLQRPSYESELQILHDMIQEPVSMLLTDNHNLVKRTLMESSINNLCEFFGKQKANDIILSHIITFLNDKDDKELRCSFFECIVDVAAYVGWHSSPILMPLLQQGLTDSEEFVVNKAIKAMAILTEYGLLHKSALYQLLSETVIFLVHPNLWIRHAAVGFISAATRTLNIVDVQCKLQPMLNLYLKHKIIQIGNEILLLEALVNPIPRSVIDDVVKYHDVDELFYVLEQRKVARQKVTTTGMVPEYNDMSTSLRNFFRRINAETMMSETVENYLLIMKPHLKKINKYQIVMDSKKKRKEKLDGKLDLGPIKHKLIYHLITLSSETKNDVSLPPFKKLDRRTSDSIPTIGTSINQEWRTMFASEDDNKHCITRMSALSGSYSSNNQSTHSIDVNFSPHNSTNTMNSTNDHSLHERSYIQYRCAPCRLELRQLICKKQEQYTTAMRARNWVDNITWQTGSRLLPKDWKPRGALVAYLHEHRAAINRLVSFPETSLFASSSSDSCIKIWDTNKMEGRNIANRSKQTYVHRGGPLIGLVVCDQGQSIASTASQSGSIFVMRVEPNTSKMTITDSRQLDLQEEGCAVDLQYLDSSSQSILVYATLYGSIIGWDLRSPGTVWKLDNDLKNGVITSFCINNYQQWLTIGTSSGTHICWDLRFQLPISTIKHPTGARVRKIITHPNEQSWIISAVQGNNEISMWNLETGFRQMVLWASSAPPLSHSQGGHSVCSMYSGCIDRYGFLLTSGTDKRLRYWNLQQPLGSYIVLPSTNISNSVTYEQRLIDGTNVVQEKFANANASGSSSGGFSSRYRGLEECNYQTINDSNYLGHHDTISAVTMSNTCILTGSTDGLIQVWK